MRWTWSHPRRWQNLQHTRRLDARADCEAIYRLIALFEMPWEMQLGHQLAYFRTLAAPSIAAVLARSGEVERRPEKRAYDTGLLMYELFDGGLDTPRGREILRRLNRMHGGWSIRSEDYLYVLTTFAVVPTRFIDRYGWRRLTQHERTATWEFYRRLGLRLGLRDIPTSYQQAESLLDSYERQHLGATENSRRLMAATEQVLADRLPPVARPLASQVLRVVLDPPVRAALGLPPPAPLLQPVLRATLGLRACLVRRLAPRQNPWFTPGQPSRVYPNGYAVSTLGPSGT